jgi:hypothetical protein
MGHDDILITMQDVRASGFCILGIKKFCKTNKIDLKRLSAGGIPMSEVSHIQDANLEVLCATARKRFQDGR